MPSPMQFDPFAPGWRRDPYPTYRELRDRAPVHWSPEAQVWCVSRYDDVLQVLKTPEVFSSRAMFTVLMNGGHEGAPPLTWHTVRFIAKMALLARMNPFDFASARNLIAEDGDSHTQLRKLVNRGFTPRRIAAWEARARELVEQCLAPFRRGEAFDLVEDLAIPLPVTIIAEMLGVEPERQRDFKRWSDTVIEGTTGGLRDDFFGPTVSNTMLELIRYLKRVAKQRQAEPRDDLISVLVAEQDGEAGLSLREVIQFMILLLVAGNETTTNLIGNATHALLDHPGELERLAADPDLVPAALEETLRYDAPIQLLFRIAREDAEVGGVRIPAGAVVMPMLGSANRDERRFEEPDRFDVTRRPQGHMGFGFGKHFCLGASLARLEARAALEGLLPLLPKVQRPAQEAPLLDSFLVRGRRGLPLRHAA